MRRNRLSLMIGVVLGISLLASLQSVSAMQYSVEYNQEFYYECTYAQFDNTYSETVLESHPMDTMMIKIRVTDAVINNFANPAYGTIKTQIWSLIPGENWEVVDDDKEFVVESNNIEPYGLVGFEDAEVTPELIETFFIESPYLIPEIDTISDTNWTQIETRFEGYLFASYGYQSAVNVERENSTLMVENIGINDDYEISLTYSSSGVMEEYSVFIENENSTHYVFHAERQEISIDLSQQQEDQSNEAIKTFVILGVVAALVIGLLSWRHNRYSAGIE